MHVKWWLQVHAGADEKHYTVYPNAQAGIASA